MKIINKKFINKFNGKIINIHPSLLPKYKGLNTFKRVLKSEEKITGCTVHYVNNKLDSGKKILQKKIFINSNDNEKSLKKKVQLAEYKAYPEAIIRMFK
jgi:folate-dependent phosphoribosylglycinamide formyltransferase PurN